VTPPFYCERKGCCRAGGAARHAWRRRTTCRASRQRWRQRWRRRGRHHLPQAGHQAPKPFLAALPLRCARQASPTLLLQPLLHRPRPPPAKPQRRRALLAQWLSIMALLLPLLLLRR
jgi:hypothetical protein